MNSAWWKPSPPGEVQSTPWLSPQVTEYLAGLLNEGMKVLEHGCGGSTLWLSARVDSVTSVESDPDWFAEIAKRAPKNVKPILWMAGGVPALEPPYDLLLIDGEPVEDRAAWIVKAPGLVRPGGVIVLDNYNRPEFERERKALEERCQFVTFHAPVGMYLNTEFFFL